ncbi:MAG: amidophosphoribosyltransferase [Defluviitaleaceae bacterium]|nr:amidophosphoribosyltransferase [Defluviitaleaceae bacterium]
MREKCGVFGIYSQQGRNDSYCAAMSYMGLMALQHRGQEACGIAVNRTRELYFHKNQGLVNEVFNDEIISKLTGQMAIGHVHYSTVGGSRKENAQPLVLNYAKGSLAIAHNGSIINAQELKREYEQTGAIYQTTSDTEIIAYTIARQRIAAGSIEKAVLAAMRIIKGAYSLILLSPNKFIAARDPLGMRPLCMGRKDDGSVVVASESCALDAVGAEFWRDIEPGEVIVIENGELRSDKSLCGNLSKLCIFEYIYFARPDSVISGQLVNDSRRIAGRMLAKSFPVDADIVIDVPDSGTPSALGYAEESGIAFEQGFGKNRYVGRTFIRPDQLSREGAVRLKLNPMRKYIEGKRVIMVDDSVVRGTTMGIIIKMLRDIGAKEVHLRISSPPFLWPCYYGTDVSGIDQLISKNYNIKELCKIFNADSLAFLKLEDLQNIIPNAQGDNLGFCKACFTGEYPVM